MNDAFSLAFVGAPGPFEMLLIFAVALMLFGAKRLPEIARSIGSIMTEMRRASRDFQDQVMKEVDVDVEPPDAPNETEPPSNIGGGDQFPRGADPEFEAEAELETDEAPDDADDDATDEAPRSS